MLSFLLWGPGVPKSIPNQLFLTYLLGTMWGRSGTVTWNSSSWRPSQCLFGRRMSGVHGMLQKRHLCSSMGWGRHCHSPGPSVILATCDFLFPGFCTGLPADFLHPFSDSCALSSSRGTSGSWSACSCTGDGHPLARDMPHCKRLAQ